MGTSTCNHGGLTSTTPCGTGRVETDSPICARSIRNSDGLTRRTPSGKSSARTGTNSSEARKSGPMENGLDGKVLAWVFSFFGRGAVAPVHSSRNQRIRQCRITWRARACPCVVHNAIPRTADGLRDLQEVPLPFFGIQVQNPEKISGFNTARRRNCARVVGAISISSEIPSK